MAAYVRDGYGAFRQSKFECGCCEMLVFKVCDVRQKLYVYSMVVDFTIFNLAGIILYVNYDGNRCNSSIVVQV